MKYGKKYREKGQTKRASQKKRLCDLVYREENRCCIRRNSSGRSSYRISHSGK